MPKEVSFEKDTYFNSTELETLFACIKRNQNLRHYVLFKLLFQTGRRVGEIVGNSKKGIPGVLPKDIDFDAGTITFTLEKQGVYVKYQTLIYNGTAYTGLRLVVNETGSAESKWVGSPEFIKEDLEKNGLTVSYVENIVYTRGRKEAVYTFTINGTVVEAENHKKLVERNRKTKKVEAELLTLLAELIKLENLKTNFDRIFNISPRRVNQILRHYVKLAKLPMKKRLVHSLRHSFAIQTGQYMKTTKELRDLQEILGHSDIKTTEIYMKHQETNELDLMKKVREGLNI